jgi:hypothetical protein
MNTQKFKKSTYAKDIKECVFACNALRKDSQNPIDISIGEFVNSKWGISMDTLYDDLGLNANIDTISNIFTMPDENVRWLIPEIIRDALRLGLRKSPIWSDFIAAEQTIANPSVTIPHLNMSESTPHYVGEAQTIPTGDISFGQKTLKVRKMGRGIKIPYEVAQYVTINVFGIYLQDFGVKLNHAIDSLMIDVLINGEQTDGSESAPVIGITGGPGTMAYIDLLRTWIRMARIGRSPFGIIGGENSAISTLNLDEFKVRQSGTTEKVLDLKTPLPQSSAYYIHGSMPTDQQMLVDKSSAIIKYNAQPLLVEEDKIVSKQVLETYATLTTGFGIVFRDARVIIDQSLDFAGNGFPSYMDVDPLEQVSIVE